MNQLLYQLRYAGENAAQTNARISDLDKQVAISYLERTLAKLYRKQLIQ